MRLETIEIVVLALIIFIIIFLWQGKKIKIISNLRQLFNKVLEFNSSNGKIILGQIRKIIPPYRKKGPKIPPTTDPSLRPRIGPIVTPPINFLPNDLARGLQIKLLPFALQAVFEMYKISIDQLTRFTELNQVSVESWLTGQTLPDKESMNQLCDYLRSRISRRHRIELMQMAGFGIGPVKITPIGLYLSCHGPDLIEERQLAARFRQLYYWECNPFQVEEGEVDLTEADIRANLRYNKYLLMIQGFCSVPTREVEYKVITELSTIRGLYFQRVGKLQGKAKRFRKKVGDCWIPFADRTDLEAQALEHLYADMIHHPDKVSLPPMAELLWQLRKKSSRLPLIDLKDFVDFPSNVEAAPNSQRPTEKPKPEQLPMLVRVESGSFYMGTNQEDLEEAKLQWENWMARETKKHLLYLQTYYVGCHPVTNAEFSHFIQSDGYNNSDFWTPYGWNVKESEKWSEPRYWNDEKWNLPNLPVVGVSWYEAVAYCHWLSTKTDQFYRLPTEAEWEKAARGDMGRIWPWGNEWHPDKCNTWEKGPHHTTAVKCSDSLQGRSKYGAIDMVGNVWEWCTTAADKFKDYPYKIEDEWQKIYSEEVKFVAKRGGSWRNSSRIRSRCACRERSAPSQRSLLIGFRVVLPLFASSLENS